MRLNLKMLVLGASTFTGLLFLAGCAEDEGIRPSNDVLIEQRGPLTNGSGTPLGNTALIGLSTNNELVSLMSGPPVADLGSIPITGLRVDELMLAIDTRPKTKQLYGVSSSSFIYRIDKATGVATPVSLLPFSPAINGDMVGFDFNPFDEIIRLVTSSGQNLRISPTTGAVVGVDVNIGSFTATINSVAYSFTSLSSKSTLFDIDIADGVLYKQTNPNGGTLQLVGSLGFIFSGEGAFEISNRNVGYAIQYGRNRNPQPGGNGGVLGGLDDTSEDAYRLFVINLTTGAAISMGKVRPMIGLAVR